MTDDFLLLNPGPVPVAREVREAAAEPLVSHRSAAFEETYRRARTGLDYVFERSTPDESRTSEGGTSLILNGTATMGMEALVSNLAGPDDEVVTLVNGKFGRRFRRIAERYATVTAVESEWGEPIDLDAVADAVTDDTALVTMVHNETSTGLLNPVAAVGEIAAAHDALFVVDGVTSLGGDEFRLDDWNVDAAVTDAQKALAAPPGVSAVYLTERAIAAVDGDRGPFYADLDKHLTKVEDDQTPFTSAVPLVRSLALAVDRIREEGMSARIARHRRQAAAFRAAFDSMGLAGFPRVDDATTRSNTVTAIALPDPVREDPDAFFETVSARGVGISGGQAHLGGEIFRVSNMGELSSEQVLRGVRAVGESLTEVGFDADVDAGLAAARDELA